MTILAIVGSEQKKFIERTEIAARAIIRAIIQGQLEIGPLKVISGECHLGGIDTFTKEEATKLGVEFEGFPPRALNWTEYRHRNLKMAKVADKTVCITLKYLPEGYKKMGWEDYCYHCKTFNHVKSGGCWTVKQARLMGKEGEVIVIK